MNKDLTVGKPSTVLWKFCLPLFGSIIFQQLYNLADSYVAGNFINQDAFSSIGNSYEITLIYLSFAFGCNIGCSVITSRFFGSKEYSKMKTAIFTSMISTLALCIILLIIGLIGSNLFLRLINTPDNLFDGSKIYLDIYTKSLPFVFLYNLSTGIFSALGDSKTPFYFLAASSIANIAADIIFVKCFNLGIPGIAWATFSCQGISCILSLIVVFLRLKKIHTPEKYRLFDTKIFLSFLKIAVPSILQQSFISVGNIILQGVINSFGSDVTAGYAAGVKLNNLVITSFTTIGNGISNFASQNIGARKLDRIHPGFKAGIKMVWIICIPIMLFYLCFPEILVKFFVDEPTAEALKTGTIFLRILTPFYPIVPIKLISDGNLRGAGMMKQFMCATFTDLILRVVIAIVLSNILNSSIGIWCAWPIGWIIATALSYHFYRKGEWFQKTQ